MFVIISHIKMIFRKILSSYFTELIGFSVNECQKDSKRRSLCTARQRDPSTTLSSPLILKGLISEADVTLAGCAALLVLRLDGEGAFGDKLLGRMDRGQPVTVQVGKVVTGTASTLTLHERVSPEVLQAAPRRAERLSAALVARSRVQEEGVARPQAPPPGGAGGDGLVLAVEGSHGRAGLTHHTAADVGDDLRAEERHHGYGGGGGQPAGLVVAAGIVAGGAVAVGERHGGEDAQAGAGLTKILRVSALLRLQVNQAVAGPEQGAASGAQRDVHRLAVDHHQEARPDRDPVTRLTRVTWRTSNTLWSNEALQADVSWIAVWTGTPRRTRVAGKTTRPSGTLLSFPSRSSRRPHATRKAC